MTNESVAGVDLHIATRGQMHSEPVERSSGPTPEVALARETTAHKRKAEAGHRSIYKRRKAIIAAVPIRNRAGGRLYFRRTPSGEGVPFEW